MTEKRIKQNENRDVGTLNGLPVDLVRLGILTLLPVETLIILRSVCKSFLSIIDDWSFVTSHLRRFPGNLRQSRFLILVERISNRSSPSSTMVYELSPPYSTWKMVYDYKYDPQEPMTLNWGLNAASLDGVLLFVLRGTVDGRYGYVAAKLLNLSIKKHRRLCLPSELVLATQFGLGYDPASSDYKVVATTSFPEDQAWIYSVKAGSWTRISNGGWVRAGIFGGRQSSCSGALAFNGGVAWVEFSSTIKWDYNHHRLVRFDFAIGRFRYAEMPYDQSAPWFLFSGGPLFLLDGGSTVGVWGVDADENKAAWVWALETGTMAWTRRYQIAPGGMPTSMVATGNRVIRVDETSKDGELVWTYHNWWRGTVNVLSYDVKMKTVINRIQVSVGSQNSCLGVYHESLVLLR